MNGREELIRRLALKRRTKLGPLSDEAFGELELAVREDPARFVDDAQEQAFLMLVQALERYESSRKDDDLLDDEQYTQQRAQRMERLSSACADALQVDKDCVDAAVVLRLVSDEAPLAHLDALIALDEHAEEAGGALTAPVAGDAWADVFARPRLRLRASIARSCLNTARFRMSVRYCQELLAIAPLDAVGARFTCALAMARLEDEEGFNWLDARDGRRGNAWFHLSRVLLMYKLGRLAAARRALRGFDQLCTGGAYLLLQPVFVDAYLPDRPEFAPGSFEESLLATHEADPIIADVPDFALWAGAQPGFMESAKGFCDRNGFEWRDWDDQG